MGIGKRIKEARERANLTQEALGRLVGVTGSSITNYEKETSHPKEPVLYALIKVLGVDANFLFQDCVSTIPQKQKTAASEPDTAANIAKRYGGLDDHGKRTVCAVVSEEERRIQALQKPAPEDNVIRVHWNNQPASAGEGFDLSDEHMYQWTVRYNELTRKADFCLDVQGHSMEPKFHDGDTVLIRQQPAVDVGEVGLFIVDGKGFIKKQGPDHLISLNPESKDIWPGEYSDVRCVGKVLGVLEPEWIISR